MILGKIYGKTTTSTFSFLVEGNAKKFDYLQVFHEEYGYILCQVIELTRDADKTLAECTIMGYKDKDNQIKQIRTPFMVGAEVLLAQTKFISEVIKLDPKQEGAYIGLLEGKDIKVKLDLKKLLTKHVAILAKTGAGKSYTLGVLLEEIMEKDIPLLVIDPHGEYSQMKLPNESKEEIQLMPKFNIKPKGYMRKINEYGNQDVNPNVKPLRLTNKMNPNELLHLLPSKLTSTQKSIIFSALKDVESTTFKELIYFVEQDESSSKFTVVNTLTYLMNLGIFSSSATPINELIQPGKCSIINLKGYNPEIQEIIVYKIMKDLFEQRKKGFIPPFFAVIEESHNFCPERNFGEAKSSSILRTIASEGRKFGLGLAVVSQRPARVDNNVLSQCNTQIILKVTNPSDLKAISKSVEGMTKEAEAEIRNLPIGTAMVTGLVDMPLFVNIRTRKSQHGGSSVDMFNEIEASQGLSDKRTPYSKDTVLPIITPKIKKKDIEVGAEKPLERIDTYLVPGVLLFCTGKTDFNLLVDLIKGEVVTNSDTLETAKLPDLSKLTPNEIELLKECYKRQQFRLEDLQGSELLRVQNYINLLKDKGFILTNGIGYKINQKIILKDLSNYANYDSISLTKVAYTKKLTPKMKIEEIKERISKFTKIENARECFIVHFRPIYKK